MKERQPVLPACVAVLQVVGGGGVRGPLSVIPATFQRFLSPAQASVQLQHRFIMSAQASMAVLGGASRVVERGGRRQWQSAISVVRRARQVRRGSGGGQAGGVNALGVARARDPIC